MTLDEFWVEFKKMLFDRLKQEFDDMARWEAYYSNLMIYYNGEDGSGLQDLYEIYCQKYGFNNVSWGLNGLTECAYMLFPEVDY